MWARYVGHKLHVKGLASVAQLRKRPTSASHAERELPKLATSGLCSRENRSQINCTIAMKFKTHTPSPNAIMNRSMNRPRIHTSRVDGLSFGAFLSMHASVRCIGLRYYVFSDTGDSVRRNCCGSWELVLFMRACSWTGPRGRLKGPTP